MMPHGGVWARSSNGKFRCGHTLRFFNQVAFQDTYKPQLRFGIPWQFYTGRYSYILAEKRIQKELLEFFFK